MKYKRVKKASKVFENYIRDFNSQTKLRVLVDIGFAKESSIINLNIVDKINELLNANAELYTTSCLLKECEMLGNILVKTYDVMKNFKLIKCNHIYDYQVGAVKCISRYLEIWSGFRSSNNVSPADAHHIGEIRFWSLATNDKDLLEIGKRTSGLPIFILKYSCIQLLPYGKASIESVKNKEQMLLENMKNVTKSTLEQFDINDNEKVKKVKKKKNPNPLSIKKSKLSKIKSNVKVGLRKKQMKVTDSVKIAINKVRKENGLEPLTDPGFPKFIHYYGQ